MQYPFGRGQRKAKESPWENENPVFTSSKNIIPSWSYLTSKIAYILWHACRPYTNKVWYKLPNINTLVTIITKNEQNKGSYNS